MANSTVQGMLDRFVSDPESLARFAENREAVVNNSDLLQEDREALLALDCEALSAAVRAMDATPFLTGPATAIRKPAPSR